MSKKPEALRLADELEMWTRGEPAMTKQLLEMAAKAAGMRCIEYTNDYDGSMGLMQCDEHGRHTYPWNPLADDGDALRLAVKLNIVIWECAQYNRALGEVRYGKARGEYWEPVGDDPYAATRRAIVRAAAEIGRMK